MTSLWLAGEVGKPIRGMWKKPGVETWFWKMV